MLIINNQNQDSRFGRIDATADDGGTCSVTAVGADRSRSPFGRSPDASRAGPDAVDETKKHASSLDRFRIRDFRTAQMPQIHCTATELPHNVLKYDDRKGFRSRIQNHY